MLLPGRRSDSGLMRLSETQATCLVKAVSAETPKGRDEVKHATVALGGASRLRPSPRAKPYEVDARTLDAIRSALQCSEYSYVAGSTHGFYHYPARFSAAIARTVIEAFSEPGDWVLDPFMGGGTSIVEGLGLGRRVLGVDINTLAEFVTRVRTTPLSIGDEVALVAWATRTAGRALGPTSPAVPPKVKNLPPSATAFLDRALGEVQTLDSSRQRRFARCVLLRLGQWGLDCRLSTPRRSVLAEKLVTLTGEMLHGIGEFTARCRGAGLTRRDILQSRRLVCRSAVGFETDGRLGAASRRPRVIVTSPPYAGVHVVYHRWQHKGRRETSAPYWIASLQDGRFESYYTGGSRTPTGENHYFRMIGAAFKSVRKVIHPAGYVVQLIGFADAHRQLPRYLEAMEAADFALWSPTGAPSMNMGRQVPNRKWYAEIKGRLDASSELLLIHVPK